MAGEPPADDLVHVREQRLKLLGHFREPVMRRDVVGLELDNGFCRTAAFVSKQDVWQIFCPSSFRTSNAVLDSFRPGISRPIDSGRSDATVDVEHMSQERRRSG